MMFLNNSNEQKICILENKIWKDHILKYVETSGKGNVKYNINLIKNNEFIIRIYEPGWNKTEQIIASTIKSLNKADVFLFIKSRNFPLINNNYGYFIEIEKKYNMNIKNMTFDIKIFYEFIQQIIFCQLELFIKHGIVHNNIHECNIFIDNINVELKYEHIDKIVNSNVYFILSDFIKCKIYNPLNFTGFENEKDDFYNCSLIKNLEDTFNLAEKFLLVKIKINTNVPTDIKNKYNNLMKCYSDNFDNYKKEYNKINKQIINLCWEYITPILNIIKFEISK
jgi:hypothetical protein